MILLCRHREPDSQIICTFTGAPRGILRFCKPLIGSCEQVEVMAVAWQLKAVKVQNCI